MRYDDLLFSAWRRWAFWLPRICFVHIIQYNYVSSFFISFRLSLANVSLVLVPNYVQRLSSQAYKRVRASKKAAPIQSYR